ncbi:amino acid permease [Yinghuangia seranimata]|uniref:amino acid permease n=1 Tax=Yinghuangia seranimata TaxID=408067 RepID=UPI00248ADC68|nr:amino acid permease [Yinghuangia seranimata]MDI2131977.1 amino acid permease [Yinghuangia seranimata]
MSAHDHAPRLGVLRTKPVDAILAESGHGGVDGSEGTGLKRTMGLLTLTFFSVGATLGTGIFVVLSEAVPKAGPAVVLSFVLAAITALFSALSYAELAGTIPVSGSSYSYAYATLGEGIAWVCGWCLLLEYGVSISAVAVGWGQYVNELLDSAFGVTLPAAISNPPGESGGVINIPAVIVVALATLLLVRGVSESAKANTIMVFIKLATLAFFCAIAFTAFDAGNLSPFAPLGWAGISSGASQVFFSYIGFDAASTAGEEAKNPRRDLPLAILLSLIIVTVVYVVVALAALGAMPWTDFEGAEATLATIVNNVTGGSWASTILSLGAIISIASVVLTVLYGQTRILFAMARDGLLPPVFAKVDRRTQSPIANTLITGAFVATIAAIFPLKYLAEATSIGTLFAFAIVNVGVIVLRRTRPDLPRSFSTPLFPITPIAGVGFCAYLISELDRKTWLVFVGWLAVGGLVYALYGYRHSRWRDATGPQAWNSDAGEREPRS